MLLKWSIVLRYCWLYVSETSHLLNVIALIVILWIKCELDLYIKTHACWLPCQKNMWSNTLVYTFNAIKEKLFILNGWDITSLDATLKSWSSPNPGFRSVAAKVGCNPEGTSQELLSCLQQVSCFSLRWTQEAILHPRLTTDVIV